MKKLYALAVISIAGLVLINDAMPAGAQSAAQEPVLVFEMTAKKYDYAPDIVRIKKGTRVQLKIRATDRTHGFKINVFPEGGSEKGEPGLRIADNQNDFKLEENQERVIEFVAERAGTYTFRCSVRCGMGHGGMKGRITVE